MTTITAVELRERLEEIIDLINETGEDMILSYRGGAKKIKLSPISFLKKKSKAQKALEYFTSKEYINKASDLKLGRLNIPELDENNPHQEKLNIRKSRAQKYER